MNRKILTTYFIIMLLLGVAYGQSASDKSQLFLIHEDQVLPYMAEEYEEAFKNFKNMLVESNGDMEYGVVQTEYFTYSAIMAVDDYNGLAKHPFITGEMAKMIDKDKFAAAMDKFDGCYDSHKSYLLRLRHDLSYNGKYGLDPKEGLNFRHFDYFHVIPGKEGEMVNYLKEMMELHKKHNIKQGYRIYQSDLGLDSPMFLLVKSFKDRVAWANESDEISKKMGDDQKNMIKKIISVLQKFEHKNGNMRPDLAHMK